MGPFGHNQLGNFGSPPMFQAEPILQPGPSLQPGQYEAAFYGGYKPVSPKFLGGLVMHEIEPGALGPVDPGFLIQDVAPVVKKFEPVKAPTQDVSPLEGVVSMDLEVGSSHSHDPTCTVPVSTPPSAAEVQKSGMDRFIEAIRLSQVKRVGEKVDYDSMASLIEQRGYAKVSPKFPEMVADTTRTNTFTNDDGKEYTEHEGLVELSDFLGVTGRSDCLDCGERAKAMLENLTFIGEREYAEGAAGLAAYWKQFLDSDPEAQICAVTKITPATIDQRMKSDMYLLERILRNFTDAELEKYAGRLVVDLRQLSAPAEKVRIAMLDDWIISGSQMSSAYSNLYDYLPPQYIGRVELNLLTASAKRISEKFYGGHGLPIKAYYLAHDADGPVKYTDNNAYISGTHSSVDYDFRNPITDMAGEQNIKTYPGLAYVKRRYGRYAPRIEHLRQLLAQKTS